MESNAWLMTPEWLCGLFVGAGRFELPTSRTRTVRATKLRYAPRNHLTAAENVPNTLNCQAAPGGNHQDDCGYIRIRSAYAAIRSRVPVPA
jgi:hypothetical protein